MTFRHWTLLGALCFVAAAPAWANTLVYSNFGPGMDYNMNGFWLLTGPDFVGDKHAQSFTPVSTVLFENAVLPLSVTLGTHQLSIFLETDDGGEPGSILEQIDVTPGANPSLLTANSVLHPTLVAGQQYWLVIAPLMADTHAQWYVNSIGDNSGYKYGDKLSSVIWYDGFDPTRSAFEINGTSTPEPAAFSLAGLALLGLSAVLRKKD